MSARRMPISITPLSPELSTRLSLIGGESVNTHCLQNDPITFHSFQRHIYGAESDTTIY